MNALKGDADLKRVMLAMGESARAVTRLLRETPTEQKNAALQAAARKVKERVREILRANAEDLGSASALTPALRDRLMLDQNRVEVMARGIEDVAALPDPVGRELARWQRPNGLDIARVATPIGVIGIVYESRPNVTADAAALCLKSGNAAILRGGSESARSSQAIHAALVSGLRAAGLPDACIQLVPTADRTAVGLLLKGLEGTVDLIVPRGGKSLVARVQEEARIPVLAHLEGVCHVYVHASADPAMARAIVLNAKMRRTGVCGAAETLLVDRAVLHSHGVSILADLAAAGCEIRADEPARAAFPTAKPRERRRLVYGISRCRHRRENGRRHRRCDPAYRNLGLASHRSDRRRG
jgi:glutamate-5-semialdehyde dehydrogenase